MVLRYWNLCGQFELEEAVLSGQKPLERAWDTIRPFTFMEKMHRSLSESLYDDHFVPEDAPDFHEFCENIVLNHKEDLVNRYRVTRPCGQESYSVKGWSCVGCGKPAEDFQQISYPILSPTALPTNLASNLAKFYPEPFIPMLLGISAPICRPGGQHSHCSRLAGRLTQKLGERVLQNNPWRFWDKMKQCNHCYLKGKVGFPAYCKCGIVA